ncbi:sorting nexin-3 [Tupaia chinensis]|nr:sorting nexin-3 [Tupaia chinensis]
MFRSTSVQFRNRTGSRPHPPSAGRPRRGTASGPLSCSFSSAAAAEARGAGRSLARGGHARATCSFASRPLRPRPVSPRRAASAASVERGGAEGVRGSGGGYGEMAETVADTRRLITKPQNLNDAYGPPSNFLEIDVSNPQTVGVGRGRFTTYEIRVKTNLPIFKLKESTVRRRYSDFEWLRSELERESKVVVPPLPGKAFLRQLPFRGDDGIFDDSFIEERKQGLEQFINKVAGHPLAQNERCLHMFLQDEIIDKSYTPSKIRHA